MDIVLSIFQYIIDMGASVMMPIILLILGVAMGAKFGDSLRAGLTFGIGFIGLGAVIGIMSSTITPVANALVENFGFKLTSVDVGWPAGAALAWSTPLVPLIFLAIIATNIIMLATGLTKTMDIDIWNYWHPLFTGSIIYTATNNAWVAVLSAVINMAIIFVVADWTQKDCAEVLGLDGISLPHIQTSSWALIDYPLNWLIDKIPGINKINWSTEGIQEKFGLFGEPMIMGFVVGAVLSGLAQFTTPGVNVGAAIQQILIVGVNIAAVLVLIPRMIALLMEGLMVISGAAHEFIEKRFPGKEIYIGLDAAVATGHPFVIATGLLMIPSALILANVLPGNTTLPVADLSALVFFVIFAVVPTKGNLFRSIILGLVNVTIILYLASYAAPLMTELAAINGLEIPEGAAQITCLAVGAQWYTWIPYYVAKLLFGGTV